MDRPRHHQPQDARVDRRAFLGRMAALTAAASAGALAPVEPAMAADMRNQGALLPPLEVGTGGVGSSVGSAFTTPSQAPLAPRPVRRISLPQVAAEEASELTLAEAAALIRDGHLSPVDVVDAYLERIARLDELLQAFNFVVADAARDEAVRLARAPYRGPLHGVPLAIKDNFYTAGIPTTANSLIFADFVPDYDATVVARLKAAGAIVLGKTQMGPLATTRAGTPTGEYTTVNAWAPDDPSVSPGGSSSGSATAVAARLAASSTGTQTGGSITVPSNAQGLTGLKPTMGRVSLRGVIPLTYTRDHPGPLARDAMDAAIMLQAMAGPDPGDPRTLGLPPVPDFVLAAEPVERQGRPGLRWPTTIGVMPDYTSARPPRPRFEPEEQQEPRTPEQAREREVRRAREEGRRVVEAEARRTMLGTFEELGARIVEIEMPEAWDTLTSSTFNNVRLPERSEPFLEYLRRDVRLFGVSLSPWINGLLLSGDEYLRGQRAKLYLLRQVLDGIFGQCDAVVQTAPFPFDMIGLPLIAFPIGMERTAEHELPIGATLGGPPYGEERLLSLVAGYQAVTEWHRRRAPDPEREGVARPGGAPEPAGRGRIDALDVMELSQ